MLIKYLGFYFDSNDGGGKSDGAIEDGKLDISDVTALLGEDDLEEPDDKSNDKDEDLDLEEGDDKGNKKEDKKGKKEDKEDDLELEDLNEDDLQFNDVPSLKAISKKYPELLKDFPTLKSVYYREQQYSEIFPNVVAARETAAKANQYDSFEENLLNGNIGGILKSVKDAEPKAFEKIAEHILTTIGEIDNTSRLMIAGHIAKDIALHMSKSNDENVRLAAQWMHKWVFGEDKITGYKLNTELKPLNKDDKTADLNRREEQFINHQLTTAVTDVSSRVENLIKRSVSEAIDTKGQMTPYVLNKAVDDIISEVDKEINGDKRFKQYIDQLWLKTGENGFNEAGKSEIKTAMIRKAKSILPAIVRRVKAEALRGNAARENRGDDRDEKPLPRGRVASERKSSNDNKQSSNRDAKPKIPRGTSTYDFLSGD